jgi:type IV pilus biogenesis protein CpaD/CtpE
VRFFNVSQTSDPALPRDSAEFRLDRHLVTLPRCPNWGSESQNWSNRPSSNFGCANTTNLGLMIANPADLVGGRPVGRHARGARHPPLSQRQSDAARRQRHIRHPGDWRRRTVDRRDADPNPVIAP